MYTTVCVLNHILLMSRLHLFWAALFHCAVMLNVSLQVDVYAYSSFYKLICSK